MIAPLTEPDGLFHSILYSLVYSDLTKGVLFSVLQALQVHIVTSTKSVRISYDTTRVKHVPYNKLTSP